MMLIKLSTVGFAAVVTGVLLAPGIAFAAPENTTLDYTGGAQRFTVPDGVRALHVQAYGAAGADAYPELPDVGGPGGLGGLVSACIPVEGGEVFDVIVGGTGSTGTGTADPGAGGFGGGGTGAAWYGAGGGGASWIRLDGADVVVAGGGGGGAFGWDPSATALAGGAGGETGTAGTASLQPADGGPGGAGGDGGTAGTGGEDPDYPGVPGNPGNPGTPGTSGQGGNGGGTGDPHIGGGSGGGGGVIGGGGGGGAAETGTYSGGAGGGGSSMGPDGADFETGVREGDGQVVFDYDPDSGEVCPSSEPPADNVGAKPTLPVTGPSLSTAVSVASGMIAAAIALLWTVRKRRSA